MWTLSILSFTRGLPMGMGGSFHPQMTLTSSLLVTLRALLIDGEGRIVNGSLSPLLALYRTILLMVLVRGVCFAGVPPLMGYTCLLGYATTSFDNTDEGRLLVQNAKAGRTVRASWFRAASDTQPVGWGIWVGALWGVSHKC